MADYGLVTLSRTCVGLMSPSKIHGYLAQGKPSIYIGARGSSVADAIAQYQCGVQIAEDDGAALTALLSELPPDEGAYATMSRRALAPAQDRYTEAVGVRNLIAVVDERRFAMATYTQSPHG
jgi:colanic acid biosynthesis glycosyl transferase WcaI